MKKNILSLLLLIIATHYISAQSPGGVSGNLNYWLKADAGTNTTTNNAQVNSWTNQAPTASNSIVQGTAANRPLFRTNGLNFNPAISFDGTDDFLRTTSGVWNSNTVIIVFKPANAVNSNSNLELVLVYDIPNNANVDSGIGIGNIGNFYNSLTNSYFFNSGDNNTGAPEYVGATRDGSFSSNDPFLATVRRNSTTTQSEHRLWGAQINNATNPGDFNDPGFLTKDQNQYGVHSNRPFTIGNRHGGGNFFYEGDFLEAISYSSRVTGTNMRRIESYLALKYGITINQDTPQDYLSSANVSIYDADGALTAYSNNIAGIGRDDASGLNQKQSKSTNTNTESLVAIGNGAIASTNIANSNNFSANQSFLLWGNNGASSSIATPVNTSSGMLNRMDRIWAVQETGTVGNVQIQIPQALFGGTNQVLLVSDNATFDASDVVISLTNNAGNYEATVNFTNGDFFTFAEAPQPVTCTTTIPSNDITSYSTSFENTLDNWIQSAGDDGDWVNTNVATPSNNTGPSGANDLSYYLFIEASAVDSGQEGAIGANAEAILESPCFDLTNNSGALFNFDYHTFGAAIGQIELEVSTVEGVWTNLFTTPNTSEDAWKTSTVDLSSYNELIKLRFVGTTGTTFSSDLAIDNVRITPIACTSVTQYNAGGWNNDLPTISSSAIIASDYNTTTVGASIDACELTVTNNATLTITADEYVSSNGNITVDMGASLIIEHQGSIIQIDDTATVTNNGTINVQMTSPVLQTRDFMIMGSPMSSETKNGVYNSAFLVLNQTPSNFIPHPEVPLGGTNFADDNGNFWTTYNGNINVGEGYIVRPQDSYTDPSNEEYFFTHSQGTLNNGEITRTVIYNGTNANGNKTPNVLANPYASAISANDFINDNALVNEVYFWEHLTQPNSSIPGYNSINFSMDDISMYNLSGGTKAANDTSPGEVTTPNGVISTGQGFGIQVNGGATAGTGTVSFNNSMRLTTGNTTLRNSNQSNQVGKVWLNLEQNEYELGSSMLIAFNPIATEQIDPGYDSNRLATAISLYSLTEDGKNELSIQTKGAYQETTTIPLGFASQLTIDTSYTISLSALEGIEMEASNIFLIDRLLNISTNLRELVYSFTSDKGAFNERFELKFESENILGTSENIADTILIFPNPAKNTLNIVSAQDNIEQITIFDMRGRIVEQIKADSYQKNYTIDISQLDTALYLVKIKTTAGTINKRMIKQ